MQFHAGLEVRPFGTVVQTPHVAGGDAPDGAAVGEQHFGAGEAGIDLDAEPLGLLAQPAAQVAERNDVVAFIVEAARQQAAGNAGGGGLGQDQEAVLADRRVQRGAVVLPVGQEFVEGARVEDGAGKDVGADFRTFLDQADGRGRCRLPPPAASGGSPRPGRRGRHRR